MESLAAYRLGPDGLTFDPPLILQFTADLPLGRSLIPIVISEAGDVTGLDATALSVERDPETGLAIITTHVAHFSDYVYLTSTTGKLTTVTAGPIADQPFASSFDVTANIMHGPYGWDTVTTYTPSNGREVRFEHFTSAGAETWTAFGVWRAAGAVTPTMARNPQRDVRPVSQASVDVEQTFTCTAAGSFTIGLRGIVGIHVQVTASGTFASGSTWGPNQRRAWTTQEETKAWAAECIMPSIVAAAAPPITVYTLSLDVGGEPRYAWFGANCGFTTGSDTKTYTWHHGEEDCEHQGEAHPDALISVLISGTLPDSGAYELQCEYRSAASGTGAACRRTR